MNADLVREALIFLLSDLFSSLGKTCFGRASSVCNQVPYRLTYSKRDRGWGPEREGVMVLCVF